MADARLVASRYAQALSDAVTSDSDFRRSVSELGALARLVKDSQPLRRALQNPVIAAEAKGRVVGEVAERAGASDATRRFLAVLADKERLGLIPEVFEASSKLLDERTGVCQVEIRSASALSDEDRAKLGTTLKAMAGGEVRISETVDPTLIGGIVAQIGTTVFDGSLKTRLETLRTRMSGGATGNISG